MKTSKFKFYVLMAIPLILLSCGTGKRGADVDRDTTMMGDTSMGTRDTTMRGGMMDEEGDFVMDAASGGLMEVELGKLAEKNSTNSRVKKIAAMMVTNHGKVNDELKSIASRKNVQYPTIMDDKHHRKMTDLQEKKGAEFDEDYIDLMVDNHERMLTDLRRGRKNEDPDLKSFAAKTLPTLLMHLDSAKAIKEKP